MTKAVREGVAESVGVSVEVAEAEGVIEDVRLEDRVGDTYGTGVPVYVAVGDGTSYSHM